MIWHLIHKEAEVSGGRQERRAWGNRLGVEESLEDEDGSNLVDDFSMRGAGATGGMEMAMGLGGGEPFVPQVEGKLGLLVHEASEVLSLGGLRAEVARHVERIADDDGAAVMATGKAGQGAEVVAAVGANEGEHGLCGKAESIGDGYADAAVPDVQAHEAVRGGWTHEREGFGSRWIGRACRVHGSWYDAS